MQISPKLLFISLFFSFCSYQAELVAQTKPEKPLNIILMIGDGMGPAHIKAYRKFMDDPNTAKEEKTLFDQYLVGSLSTDPADPKENITDSSAAATAYSTGQKIANEVVALDVNGNPIETVLEKAKKQGLSTGLVVTSHIIHATPASFAAHNISRRNYNEIADQYFDNQHQGKPMVDIMLGGGTKYFKREDRNLVSEFVKQGYSYVETKQQLLNSESDKMLGLFGEVALAKMLDREKFTPSLADMTKVALKQLSKNNKGFFLMVEGSQIDWASHSNDIVGVMSEMQDFELAFKQVIDFAKQKGNTLVILTADHETGGLSVGSSASGKGRYYWNYDALNKIYYTPEKIARDAKVSKDLIEEFNKGTSIKLTAAESKSLKSVDFTDWYKSYKAVAKIINQRSFTGWTSEGHTGVDVNLYAFGPGSESLRGHWDNTKVGRVIFEWLERKSRK